MGEGCGDPLREGDWDRGGAWTACHMPAWLLSVEKIGCVGRCAGDPQGLLTGELSICPSKQQNGMRDQACMCEHQAEASAKQISAAGCYCSSHVPVGS